MNEHYELRDEDGTVLALTFRTPEAAQEYAMNMYGAGHGTTLDLVLVTDGEEEPVWTFVKTESHTDDLRKTA